MYLTGPYTRQRIKSVFSLGGGLFVEMCYKSIAMVRMIVNGPHGCVLRFEVKSAFWKGLRFKQLEAYIVV